MTHEEIAKVLREYGSAIRGDWGTIDGRSEQLTLNYLAEVVADPEHYTAAQLRDVADICPHGKGHWTDHCTDTCGTE